MYKSKYREASRDMWVESQAPPAISFLVLRIVLIIGSASDWLRRPHSWQSQQFYIVFVRGLPGTENWDLSQPRSSHSSQWRELGDKMTKDEDDKKFTWQSLILTKAAHCADTERCPEKNRESWLWERWEERGERMVCGCWNIGISLKGVGARPGRMGHHDSPAGTKHFH